MREAIRRYVVEQFHLGTQPEDFDDETSFLGSGIIDSTGVMELVGFLEDEFGITVEDGELVPENLDSISSLAAFLRDKGVSAPPEAGTEAGAGDAA